MPLVRYPEIAGLQPLLLASSTTLTWSAWSPRPVPTQTPESEHKSRLIPDPAFCRHYIVLDQCYCFRLKLSLLRTSCSTLFSLQFSLRLTPTTFWLHSQLFSQRCCSSPADSSVSIIRERLTTQSTRTPQIPAACAHRDVLLGAWAQEERLW